MALAVSGCSSKEKYPVFKPSLNSDVGNISIDNVSYTDNTIYIDMSIKPNEEIGAYVKDGLFDVIYDTTVSIGYFTDNDNSTSANTAPKQKLMTPKETTKTLDFTKASSFQISAEIDDYASIQQFTVNFKYTSADKLKSSEMGSSYIIKP
jgi:hypothetical protein